MFVNRHHPNMSTVLKINKNYQIVERKVDNEKELPISLLDLIIPIMRKEVTPHDPAARMDPQREHSQEALPTLRHI